MKRSYFLERDFRRIRVRAVVGSVVVHLLFFGGLMFQQHEVRINTDALDQLVFGSSGGGGGDGAKKEDILEFGPQDVPNNDEGDLDELQLNEKFNLVTIHVYSDADLVKPSPKVEEPKKIKKKSKPILANNLPTKWLRKGSGPGSGGGTGGGSGGGIGAGQGFAIDWGGTGGRRLLSGRLPKYPEGKTDKEMVVLLQFTVLPDGTVENIIPLRKTDEALENAGIAALHTWRFEQLPPGVPQKPQIGKVPFNFKLNNAIQER